MSPPPNPQFTSQFLTNILCQSGPASLPYAEDTKRLIRQHLVSLTETHPSLQPKTATYNHNDGTTVNLLQVDGTIPMVYQSVTYNIPIIIWLMETYPRSSPCVYVAPTREMIIKRPHPHVNPSGIVSIPYLHNWVFPSSNLVDMVRNLSHLFGREPPLYTRQSQSQSRPNDNSLATTNSSGLEVGVSNLGNSRPTSIPPRAYSSLSSPYGGGGGGRFPASPQRQNTDDPNEVYRKNAINKLVDSLHGDIMTSRKNREVEMEGLISAQTILRQRLEVLAKGLREMVGEKEGLEQQLQMVLMNTDILEGWLRDNEGKMGMKTGNVDTDEAFVPCDVLSKQMFESTSSDLAIEDAIYSLDKAVREGSVPVDQYLKNIRSLSREQFFHRATAAKVRAAQMQAQVNSMAARAPQYAM